MQCVPSFRLTNELVDLVDNLFRRDVKVADLVDDLCEARGELVEDAGEERVAAVEDSVHGILDVGNQVQEAADRNK